MTTTMIVVMSINMQIGFDKGFFNYRKSLEKQFHDNLIHTLENYYQQHESWLEFESNRNKWQEIINQSSTEIEQMQPRMSPPRGPRGHRKMDDFQRNSDQRPRHPADERMRQRVLPPVVLFDAQKNHIIGVPDWKDNDLDYREILFKGKAVGYLGILKDNKQHQKQDEMFETNIKSMLFKLALFMLVLALLVAFPIAKYFTTLINKLTKATQELTKGDYSLRIQSDRKDELGRLAHNFDVLAQSLEANAQTQKSMMADIAHELRTPISVIIGEIEAMQDGVHPIDKKTLQLLHSQMSSLIALVADLHELSESDLGSLKYKMEEVDLQSLLHQSFHNYQLAFAQKDISLKIKALESPCYILGDINRLNQLFNNLLDNSLHYTGAGGYCSMGLKCNNQQVIISIQDSAPGLETEQLDKIFDRWYRADKSRNRNSGGTGLGLAICYEIIKAHNGTISAQKAALGGVEIIIKLAQKL